MVGLAGRTAKSLLERLVIVPGAGRTSSQLLGLPTCLPAQRLRTHSVAQAMCFHPCASSHVLWTYPVCFALVNHVRQTRHGILLRRSRFRLYPCIYAQSCSTACHC